MKKEVPPPIIGTLVLVILAACLLSGCSLIKQIFNDDQGVYYTGKVSRQTQEAGPVIVVLYTEQGGNATILAHDLVPTKGSYHLVTDDDSAHKILAFEDANGDFAYNKGERIAYLDTPLNAGKERDPKKWGNIVIPESGGKAPLFPIDLSEDNIARWADTRLSTVGDVVPLNDPLFDDKNGRMGYVTPHLFLQKFGPSLYMLERYTPGRKPVVLVHGVDATPRVFSTVISGLDNKKYQVWVYFWPTGMPINFSAWSLEEALQEMKELYDFDQVDLIAHSMGGLMSRAAINLRSEDGRPPIVDRFITISTPWHGQATAQWGLDMSPFVIPSWEDIAPSSVFLEQLYLTQLPLSTRHILLFSHRGYNVFPPGSGDTRISLESMLYYPVQDNAKKVYGFDETHSEILESEKLISIINKEPK